MRHPFDGILTSGSEPSALPGSRRSALRSMFAAALGVLGLSLLARAASPPRQPTTLALGEEGGRPPPPTISTRSLGEEGGRPPVITTQAVGEEGGQPPVPAPRLPVTTQRVGEEGGGRR